ncbi:hypothetical protein [Ottowia sp.]|uniref:hypothetical protein n=1 Tax=Ottowia sp. TaxID=1898956 RepID=UPI002600893B|nr:hypothetical protein [Ottowia sp.]MBK6616319.1 hypothetical protein [Ottowia sp.]
MMRSYPTLYRTRVGALIHLFGDSDATWVNGELQLSEQYNGAGNELDDISEQQLAFDSATTEEERGFAARDLAFKLRERAKQLFVFENAAVLAAARDLALDGPPRFTGKHFDDMPDDVTPDWLEAAKEAAMAIAAYKFTPDTQYVHAYNEQRRVAAEESKKVAQQFLERFQVTRIDTYFRSQRATELLREARALGLGLTDAKGQPVTAAESIAWQ